MVETDLSDRVDYDQVEDVALTAGRLLMTGRLDALYQAGDDPDALAGLFAYCVGEAVCIGRAMAYDVARNAEITETAETLISRISAN